MRELGPFEGATQQVKVVIVIFGNEDDARRLLLSLRFHTGYMTVCGQRPRVRPFLTPRAAGSQWVVIPVASAALFAQAERGVLEPLLANDLEHLLCLFEFDGFDEVGASAECERLLPVAILIGAGEDDDGEF